jgi:hypothetical protein
MMHDSYQVLQAPSLLAQAPVTIVLLAGLLIAGYRWKRHPRVSLLVTIALCLMLVGSLGVRLLLVWLGPLELGSAQAAHRFERRVSIVGFLTNLTTAIAISLLVFAAFRSRSAQSTNDQSR